MFPEFLHLINHLYPLSLKIGFTGYKILSSHFISLSILGVIDFRGILTDTPKAFD